MNYEKKISILMQKYQLLEKEKRSSLTFFKVLSNQLIVLKNEHLSIRNFIATALKDFQSMWTNSIILKDKQIEV